MTMSHPIRIVIADDHLLFRSCGSMGQAARVVFKRDGGGRPPRQTGRNPLRTPLIQ